jgi:hypothetical protein
MVPCRSHALKLSVPPCGAGASPWSIARPAFRARRTVIPPEVSGGVWITRPSQSSRRGAVRVDRDDSPPIVHRHDAMRRVAADPGLVRLRDGADQGRHHDRVDRVAAVREHLRGLDLGKGIAHDVTVRLRRLERGPGGRTREQGANAGPREKPAAGGNGQGRYEAIDWEPPQGCAGSGCIVPAARRPWYCSQVIAGLPVSTGVIVMQPSTGQTIEHRLQPTQSASRTSGTGLPGTRPGPRP